MSYTAREWSQNYDTTKKKVHRYKTQKKGPYSNQELNEINSTVKNLDLQLKTMASNPLEFEICSSELARRRVLLDNLQAILTSGSIIKQSVAPMGGGGGGGGGFGSSSGTYNPLNNSMSNSGLQQRQQEVIRVQDDMLMDLSKNIDHLQHQANTIGEEARQQNKLIGQLDIDTESSTEALRNETKHVHVVWEQANICWLYACIAVEFVILFLLVILGFTSGNL
jgi:hypothetical protein